jgi:flagellar hook-associated protein 1
MSLNNALNIAVSGLSTTQAQIDLVSQNVSNANSIGYTKRTLQPYQEVVGDRTSGVHAGLISRVYDRLVQSQLRSENAGGTYSSTRADYAKNIDQLFGSPGGAGSLDSVFNTFTQSLQSLVADPASTSGRAQVLNSAGVLSNTLNYLSNSVQSLRSGAESAIGNAVAQANTALEGLEAIARRQQLSRDGYDNAALQDERDRYIDQLSSLLDVTVVEQSDGRVNVSTNAGVTLFDGTNALRFQFDERANLSPNSLYSTDPAKSGVGQLKLITKTGGSIDVVNQGALRSGQIKSLLDLRDTVLPQAQTQLDELAANLSRALSDASPTATAIPNGFSIDLTGLKQGNSTTIDYTDQPSGIARRITIVRVDNPASLPLAQGATGNPNERLIGVDLSGGLTAAAIASIQAQISAAPGINLTASGAGFTFQIVDDGGATTKVTGLSAGITNTALTGNGPELALFQDGGTNGAYTASFENGDQRLGFAQRIRINPAVSGDPSKLVVYNLTPATPAGDSTRPSLIYDRLTKASRTFSTDAGIGGTALGFKSDVATFVRAIVNDQGTKSAQASQLNQGQQVVVNALKQKFTDKAGVSIDQELADLVKMQNAYSANARIITVVKELLDVLLRIGT